MKKPGMEDRPRRKCRGPVDPNTGTGFYLHCNMCGVGYDVLWWHMDVCINYCTPECRDAAEVRGALKEESGES